VSRTGGRRRRCAGGAEDVLLQMARCCPSQPGEGAALRARSVGERAKQAGQNQRPMPRAEAVVQRRWLDGTAGTAWPVTKVQGCRGTERIGAYCVGCSGYAGELMPCHSASAQRVPSAASCAGDADSGGAGRTGMRQSHVTIIGFKKFDYFHVIICGTDLQ
jgi:hypothetical protein